MTKEATLRGTARSPRPGATSRIATAHAAALATARRWLLAHDYVEVITPQLTPFPSEDRQRAFAVDYLGRTLYLGQSRRRYHQVVLPTLERVFEVAPTFWADPATDGSGLTQYTTLELSRIVADEDADADAAVEDVVDLVEEITTAVAAAVRSAREPPTPRCTYLGPADGPFPAPSARRAAIAFGERAVATTFWHSGEEREIARELRALTDDQALLDPFLEAFRFGVPEHVTHVVVLEALLAGILPERDLRDVTLFPRDAATTTP